MHIKATQGKKPFYKILYIQVLFAIGLGVVLGHFWPTVAVEMKPLGDGFIKLEPVSKSFEEDNEAGKLDKAEEIVGVVLPANEDPALPLNPGEEALNEPASHVAA